MNVNDAIMNPNFPKPEAGARPPATTLAVIPTDLRQWVNEPTLVIWILETVANLAPRPTAPAVPGEDGPPLPMMLSLVVYCYATGRYESAEIEANALSDDTARYLCGNRIPAAVTIRQFRRCHRGLLGVCLVQLHKRAWRHRFGGSPVMAEMELGAPGSVQTEIVFRLAAAAQDRIHRALLADTMSLDV